MAARGLRSYKLFPPRPPHCSEGMLKRLDITDYLSCRIRNWPQIRSTSVNMEIYFGAFMIADLFYGAVHFLAWNGPFRTTLELTLWRISVVTISAPGLLILSLTGVFLGLIPAVFVLVCISLAVPIEVKERMKTWAKKVEAWEREPSSNIFAASTLAIAIVSGVFVVGFALFYVFARTFILVESVITVPYLSSSVFVIPSWSSYLPHIS